MKLLSQISFLRDIQVSGEIAIELCKSNIPTCYEAGNKLDKT